MKNYYTQTLSFVLFLLCAAGVARAQHVWQNSLPQPAAAAAPVVRASDATEGKIYLGHNLTVIHKLAIMLSNLLGHFTQDALYLMMFRCQQLLNIIIEIYHCHWLYKKS